MVTVLRIKEVVTHYIYAIPLNPFRVISGMLPCNNTNVSKTTAFLDAAFQTDPFKYGL